MKIKTLRVDWMEGWANSPRWIVTFDAEAPEVYRDIGDGLLLSVVGERLIARAAMAGTEAYARAVARWGCATDDVLRDVAFYNRLNASL